MNGEHDTFDEDDLANYVDEEKLNAAAAKADEGKKKAAKPGEGKKKVAKTDGKSGPRPAWMVVKNMSS